MGFFKENNNADTFFHRRFSPPVAAIFLFVIEVAQIAVISLAIILPVRYFLIQPFLVKGASMEPNFYDREYLIINEIGYRLQEPERGDIVVFRYPKDPSEFFIKRLIALPGETVEISDGRVVIYNDDHPNGIALEELYLRGEKTNGNKRMTLGESEYYVLGDNRDESLDSRIFGSISKEEIVGKVWIRGFPLSRISLFETPEYGL